jgi:hypothetical protein
MRATGRLGQTHASRSGFNPGTNVGAGCSCHPTGCDYRRSTRVPLHPVCLLPSEAFELQEMKSREAETWKEEEEASW